MDIAVARAAEAGCMTGTTVRRVDQIGLVSLDGVAMLRPV